MPLGTVRYHRALSAGHANFKPLMLLGEAESGKTSRTIVFVMIEIPYVDVLSEIGDIEFLLHILGPLYRFSRHI